MSRPGLSLRAAADWIRAHRPDDWVSRPGAFSRQDIAADFAANFGGIPANSAARAEKAVEYLVEDSSIPALLGLYGCRDRVRRWLPGLPSTASRAAVDRVLAEVRPPETVEDPPAQAVLRRHVDLTELPVLRSTPRDAGPYLTMGMIYAADPVTGEVALSVHRMLVVGPDRLAVWMVPSRRLRAMHEAAVRRTGRLAVSVNIGVPPAAMIASALSSKVLAGKEKLAIAGALAGAPVTVAPAVSQETSVLAESEIVLEGYLDDTVTDETLNGAPDVSLPEFLGYDGEARNDLPVLTVTAVTSRESPVYQAVIGPGREQSVILGTAGALSVALSHDGDDWNLIHDLHYSPAGGGMLLLVVAVRKPSREADGRLKHIARRIFDDHPFVKLIVFTDEDVDITSGEDVLWAITTRANLDADSTTFGGFRALTMDPSQGDGWTTARGSASPPGRTYIDATVPYVLRSIVTRSFAG
ncbi:UbiD family decarboxylase [Amycolatopsis sp. CA-230715]|uniref:UbiD family decarboxylase n=1 Tax=Amycolatopsis sp. CA-230715 TaxID=2745196 RepID=UPI001C0245D6|nr:UbiD family decarboxylase [Amycolatopsis sp. CA-230715]QWF84052.1 UbiD-like decarboxylase [Amycolatopsis sp. CA-230715]